MPLSLLEESRVEEVIGELSDLSDDGERFELALEDVDGGKDSDSDCQSAKTFQASNQEPLSPADMLIAHCSSEDKKEKSRRQTELFMDMQRASVCMISKDLSVARKLSVRVKTLRSDDTKPDEQTTNVEPAPVRLDDFILKS